MLIIACLLLVPLGLRYGAAWHMARLRQRLLHEDDEFRQLQARLAAVCQELVDTRRRLRRYEVRRTFLAADLRTERQRLQDLRTARRSQRLAA